MRIITRLIYLAGILGTPLALSGFVVAASAAAGVWACTRMNRLEARIRGM
jgi:hypothetical protein